MSYPSHKKPSGSCQNINHLPDEVLEHLLSFLPTKEALATSILSKRWRYLWTRVPVLDFDCPPNWKINGKRRKTFTEFVNGVLMANKVASLNKFRLNCDIILGSSYLNTRIKSTILGRNFVQEVDISISAPRKKPEFLKLPDSFFTIKTLEVLKLSRAILIDIAPDDNMPSVCFPSLKILHLDSVQYANDESVSKLLLGCTALEKLLVERSPEDNVRKFIVNVPTLKTLDVSYQTSDDKPVGHRDDELIINAPILEHLTIKDRKGEPVSVHLESVFIRLIDANFNFEATPDLSKLTEVLLEAKSLCIKCPDSVAPVKDHSFPCFHNLTSLGLSVCSDGWDVISQFLDNSPNLEVLTLKKVKLDKNPNNTSNKFALKSLPCFLRSVYCQEFQGHDNELEMVEFLLKNVRTLESVEIYGYYGMSLKAKLCFLQKLSEFTRLSEKCKLRFD